MWLNYVKCFLPRLNTRDSGLMLQFGERMVNSSHPVLFFFSFDVFLPYPSFTDPLFLVSLYHQHHPICKEGSFFLQRRFRLKRSSSKPIGHREDPKCCILSVSLCSQRSRDKGQGCGKSSIWSPISSSVAELQCDNWSSFYHHTTDINRGYSRE